MPMVLGKGKSSTVKGIKPVKIFSLFLTRCPPETTVDEIKSYSEITNKWTISEVVKLKTRRNFYASFRVDVRLIDDSVDLMSPEYWPVDTYVRKFHRESRTGPHPRSTNTTAHND